MSGYKDCPCCGEIMIGEPHEVCDSCHAAGCEADDDGYYDTCDIPRCPDCDTHASWMNDHRWHSNCEPEECPGEAAKKPKDRRPSWDDPEAARRFGKPQRKPPIVFRVGECWQRISRIAESLRCHMIDPPGSAPHLETYANGGYPLWYHAQTKQYGTRHPEESCYCPQCASTVDDDDTRIVAAVVNWENPDLYCDCCGERVESAYSEDEHTMRNLLARLLDGEELTDDELASARDYTLEYVNSINEETIAGLKKHLPEPDEETTEDE